MKDELSKLDFRDPDLGYIDGKIVFVLSGESSLFQILINNYLKVEVQKSGTKLVIYPNLIRRIKEEGPIEDITVNVTSSKFIVKPFNVFARNIEVFHKDFSKLDEKDHARLLYAILDNKFDEFEQLYYLNDIKVLTKKPLLTNMVDYSVIQKEVYGDSPITIEEWKKTYFQVNMQKTYDFSYRGSCEMLYAIDPRFDVEYFYKREKRNKFIDLLSIKFVDEGKNEEEVSKNIKMSLENSVVKISFYTNGSLIMDFLVFDREEFLKTVQMLKDKLNLQIDVYDNYKNEKVM